MRAARLVLVVTVCAANAACVFPFPRELEDAEVKGVLLRADGEPAATAFASVPGTQRVASADEDGVLSFKDVPPMRGVARVLIDDDADGIAEQGALVPFVTAVKEVKKNLTDGIFTAPVAVVNGLLYGEVTLEETTTVSGTVLEEGSALGAGRVARVLVFRVREVGALDSTHTATLPVEASTVTADGSFTVSGVLPGAVQVVALIGPEGGDTARVGIVEAQAGDDGVTIDAAETALGTFQVQIDLIGATERATLDAVETYAPGTNAPPLTQESVGAPAAGSHVIAAPRGVFDLFALVGGGDPSGLALGLVVASDTLPPFMPIELPVLVDACESAEDGVGRDCDRDSIEGLPPIEASGADAAYDACMSACSGLAGGALDGATCDGVDCDDDADGVPDVDERNCVGPLFGTDTDGDNLCEPAADPFPLCAANTIAACL
jgi:hypothetical protein